MAERSSTKKQLLGITQAHMATISRKSKYQISRKVEELKKNAINDSNGKNQKYTFADAREVIKDLFDVDLLKIKNKVIVVYNFKGGSGKSTIAVHVSYTLALLGFKILFIDFDPQGNSTEVGFGIDADDTTPTMYDVIVDNLDIRQAIINVQPGLDVIPAEYQDTKIDRHLFMESAREVILKDHIEEIKNDYDLIIIDTNPSLNQTVYNALYAADFICIPSRTAKKDAQSTKNIISEYESFVKKQKSLDPAEYLIIPSQYENNKLPHQEGLGLLRAVYNEKGAHTVVRTYVDYDYADKYSCPLYYVSKYNSEAVLDITSLTHELLSHISTNYEFILDEE